MKALVRTNAADLHDTSLAALVSAGGVAAAGVLILALTDPGPLAIGMALHIAIMNVLAPVIAIYVAPYLPRGLKRRGVLALAGIAQMVLLWIWHAPSVQLAASAVPAVHAALLISLAGSAILFWSLLLRLGAVSRWRGLVALLLTGKFACLLGGLLIFASRDLYGIPGMNFLLCSTGPSTLADQHLAGLLMITACPLSYVIAGIVFTGQMMGALDEGPAGEALAGR